MKKLVIRGDPGLRRGAIIGLDGEQYQVFGVARQGEWHGPDRVQLWCTIGQPDEKEHFETRAYVPMHLETLAFDADEVTVIEKAAPN